MDGFSVLLPTYNSTDNLKWAIKSLHKNSKLETEICIVMEKDPGEHWDLHCDIFRLPNVRGMIRAHKGAFSAWNEAAKLATKEWFFIGESDFWWLPGWDRALKDWIANDPDRNAIFGIQLIEPRPMSYLHCDCGDNPENFDEAKATAFMRTVSRHSLKPQAFSLFAVHRDDWFKVGGYDEAYDPCSSGTRDLQMKLHKLKPRRWVIAEDSFAYHAKLPHRHVGGYHDDKYGVRNSAYFEKKWGITIEQSENYLSHI